MENSQIRVSYIVFPIENEDGTLGYAAACVASEGNKAHPIGMIRFESLSLIEEFATKVIKFCEKEKIRGLPNEVLNAFKDEGGKENEQ